MSTSDAYIKKYMAQLDLVDAEIDRLEVEARTAKVDMKMDFGQQLADLRGNRNGAKDKLAEIKLATGDARKTLKQGVEDVWASVSAAWGARSTSSNEARFAESAGSLR